jgi:hypothetical protein
MLRIYNDAGRAFNVRLVRKGDRYSGAPRASGLNDKLTHDKHPMVEFYDATYENDARFDLGRGQFTSRYYVSTLFEENEWKTQRGLDLCGHEDVWKLDGVAMTMVMRWLRATVCTDHAREPNGNDCTVCGRIQS